MNAADSATQKLTRTAATRAEVAVSAFRALFCLAMLGRFLAIGSPWNAPGGLGRTLLVVPGSVIAIGLSGFVIAWWWRGRRLGMRTLAGSVTLDVLVAVMLLASNSLFPGDAYRGVFSGPDLAALLVVVIASGLRLSRRLALLSGGLALGGMVLLAGLDATMCPMPVRNTPSEAGMWVVFLGAVTGVAWMAGRQTRHLLRAATLRAERLARTRGILEALQGVHHDAHSTVGAMTLTSDRLLRALDEGRSDRVTGLGRDLREQADLVAASLREVREGAAGELLVDRPIAPACLAEALRETRRHLAVTAPDLQVHAPEVAPSVRVAIGGGQAGLVRVLLNLLHNAAQGDGRRRARRVEVACTVAGERVELVLEDDGPGLAGPARPGGHGVGLRIVRSLVEEAGGRFALVDGDRGARAEVRLPRAEAQTPARRQRSAR